MSLTKPGMMATLCWHGWNLLRLRGDWKSMPDSRSFLGIVLILVFLGGMAEQFSRGHELLTAAIVTVSWLVILLWSSRQAGAINRRLAFALGLLSIMIQAGLILSTWMPVTEWPVAI